nr:unnamed protein product [Digitaria exilis]
MATASIRFLILLTEIICCYALFSCLNSALGRWQNEEEAPSQLKIVGVQASGGIIAGAVTSFVTTPIDTIKTRLQVLNDVMDNENKPKASQVVKRLIAEDGWKGLYRGLGPRFFSSSAWGTSMIVCYEYLSMFRLPLSNVYLCTWFLDHGISELTSISGGILLQLMQVNLHTQIVHIWSLVYIASFRSISISNPLPLLFPVDCLHAKALAHASIGLRSGEGGESKRRAMDEAAVQEAKLLRQVNALIVAHLRGQSLGQAAAAVAAATMTPLSAADSVPDNHLLRLVAKGLAAERAGGAASAFDSAGFGGVVPTLGSSAVDFSVQDARGSSKSFPKHEARHVSDHKNIARCAKFSHDGKYFATGSADTSIKFFEVAKIKQTMAGDSKDSSARPVIRTFYDHMQPINDLDFHPESPILVSASKDNTIKFFDFSKTNARKAFRVIQVRYSCTGSLYVTASKDGSLRIWDGVSAECVRPIIGAHGSAEATSAVFTKDERYLLSCGKDSSVKLWEVGTGRLVKQYTGSVRRQFRCQAVFNETEEFVLSVDEQNNEVVVWDALTAEKVARLPSGGTGAPRWLDHSPTEPAFVTCGSDRSIRFWKQTV